MARILLDANVFMYAAGGEHPYRDPARSIVQRLADSRGLQPWTPCVDSELFQEIAYRYASIGKAHVGHQLQRHILALPLRVLAVDEAVVGAFIDAQAHHADALEHRRIAVRDLLHLAVMSVHGIGAILTADRDFDGLPGVRRVDLTELG